MDTQLTYVSDVASKYFDWLASCSRTAPPPGVNAANGYFHDAVVADNPNLPAAQSLTGDAASLFACYQAFRSDLQGCFVNAGNHGASAWSNITLMIGWLQRFGADVVGVIMSILSYANSSGQQRDDAKVRLANEANELIDRVAHSRFIPQGTHANGFISAFTQDAANRSLAMVQPLAVKGPETDAGRMAKIWQTTMQRLAGLSRDGHDPWLRPDWQIAFQTICASAAEAFRI